MYLFVTVILLSSWLETFLESLSTLRMFSSVYYMKKQIKILGTLNFFSVWIWWSVVIWVFLG